MAVGGLEFRDDALAAAGQEEEHEFFELGVVRFRRV